MSPSDAKRASYDLVELLDKSLKEEEIRGKKKTVDDDDVV